MKISTEKQIKDLLLKISRQSDEINNSLKEYNEVRNRAISMSNSMSNKTNYDRGYLKVVFHKKVE